MAQERLAPPPKKVAEEHAHLVLIDETGLFLNPTVRRSWAPKGRTPVVGGDGGHRKKVSVIGAVSVSPAAGRLGLYFATLADGFFTADRVVEFLRDLPKHRRGNVAVVWGRGSNHRGRVVRDFLRRNRRRRLEMPPGSAPDLNPVEAVWAWLRHGRRANFVPAGLADLDDEAVEGLIDLKFDPGVLRGLWEASDLPFPDRPKVEQGSRPASRASFKWVLRGG